jgi:UDP-N-acetylglucosamine transferase subunit ALG13
VIFVTVGHQMPFDRLVKAVDAWAEREGRADLFAQIGEGDYWPSYFPAAPFLTPEQFRQRMNEADGIVAHAGTGTIIAALQLGKPLLVLPRRADLNETRNDHQFATAAHFRKNGSILVAETETELAAKLSDLEEFRPEIRLGDSASPELITHVRSFVFGP